jgi:hypothetical protein
MPTEDGMTCHERLVHLQKMYRHCRGNNVTENPTRHPGAQMGA